MDSARTCLDIPLPKNIRDFISNLEPPVCFRNTHDTEITRLIHEFGTKNKCDRKEIVKAQQLAAGLPDIVIILERPTGDYHLPFSKFVADCKTLSAVDELIRVATRGFRSIHTTTVLDLYMLKPKGRISPSDQDSFELLGKILEIKQPQVVLCCSCKKQATGHWIDEFMSPGVGTWPMFEVYQDKVPITTTRYFSFHPSKAINYEPCDVYYRILLMMHFIFAFRRLGIRSVVPPGLVAWIKEISIEAKSSASTPVNFVPIKAAARHLRELLDESRTNSNGRFQRASPDIEEVVAMFNRLTGLRWTGGGLAIAKLMLLLGKISPKLSKLEEFEEKKARLALVVLGNEQDSFEEVKSTTRSEESKESGPKGLSERPRRRPIRRYVREVKHSTDEEIPDIESLKISSK